MIAWNAFNTPPAIGTQIHYLAEDGTIAQGVVAAHRVVRLRGLPGLGKQWRCLVKHSGELFAPVLVVVVGDQIGLEHVRQVAQGLATDQIEMGG